MGAFLDKPKTEKHNEDGEGNGLKYGLSSMQGWRVEMEDAHTWVALGDKGKHPCVRILPALNSNVRRQRRSGPVWLLIWMY